MQLTKFGRTVISVSRLCRGTALSGFDLDQPLRHTRGDDMSGGFVDIAERTPN
jgi:hypothetical protein